MELTAKQVVDYIIKSDGEFKANWTGAWDLNDGQASVVEVNVGSGPEKAVKVLSPEGHIGIYVGPYELENKPSKEENFLFYCNDGWFIFAS